MKKKALRKSKRFTIRLTPNENKRLRKRAKRAGESISNYMISCSDNLNRKVNNHHIKKLDKDDARTLERIISAFYANINHCYHDYSNALDNLEHDNNLMNHGKLSGLPQETLRETFSAVIRNQKTLKKMRNELSKIEMNLYDN